VTIGTWGVRPGWLVAGVGVLVLAALFRGLLLPVVLAAALAYMLNPLVVWVEGFGIRRSVAVAGLSLGLLLVVAAGAVLVGPRLRAEAGALAAQLPFLADEVDAALQLAAREITEKVPALRRVMPRAEARTGWIDRLLEGRAGDVSDWVEHAGRVALVGFLVPFFGFFLLRDSRRLVAWLMDRLPAPHVETSVALCCEIDRLIGRYVRGVAIDGLVFGILVSFGLWVLGVPYQLLLGALAGLANAIPVVGSVLAAAAAALVALGHGQGLGAVGQIALLFLGLKLLDDAVIQPLTIGRGVHLHPALLVASVVAGNQLLGILGMIVAVPTVTVLQETVRLLLEHRRVLAGDVAPPVAPIGYPI
jgi:predicted PurR-regulated permease PerM